MPYIKEYKNIIGNILFEKCQGINEFIGESIINGDYFRDYDEEGKTFFYKIMGDYYRYLCEVDIYKPKVINEANKYYNEALKISNNLPIYNPVKIGLKLNISVFYYEVIEDKKKAINLAEKSKEKYEKEIVGLNKENDEIQDAECIYNIIKENLDLWKNDK